MMALNSDNVLHGWGSPLNGEFGLGWASVLTTVPRSSPVQLGGRNWTDVSAGFTHFSGVKSNGTAYLWGINSNGVMAQMIGAGSTYRGPTYLHQLDQVPSSWSSLTLNESITTGKKTDGSFWYWGISPGLSAVSSPVQISGSWSNVYPGRSHVMGVRSTGDLYTWGAFSSGQLGWRTSLSSPIQVSSNVNWQTISAGRSYVMAIRTNGTLWTWGRASTAFGIGLTSVNYTFIAEPVQVGSDSNWSKVAAGPYTSSEFTSHTAAVKTNGTLWTWGRGGEGQLGNNFNNDRSFPTQMDSATNWSNVATYEFGTLGLKTDGTLWAWGDISNGKTGADWPVEPKTFIFGAPSNYTKISLGYTSAGIKTDGTLWAWGDNQRGGLGQNNTTTYSSSVQVGSATDWIDVAAGAGYVLALKSGGTLWAWGNNLSGSLGDGTVINRSSPVQIGADTNWSKVFAGYLSSGAIKSTSTMWMWGNNTSGQLGHGDALNRSSPVQTGAGNAWSQIFIGNRTSFSLTTSGTLWAVGSNASGMLGLNNSSVAFSTRQQIGALAVWSKAAPGVSHTLFTRTNGTMWAVGLNSSGQFGTNNATNASSPVQVGALTGWLDIATGLNVSFGVRSDSTLWRWGVAGTVYRGDNFLGTAMSSPVQVGTSNNWLSLRQNYGNYSYGSPSMTLALSNTSIWAWGENSGGGLGLGHTMTYPGNGTGAMPLSPVTYISSPVQVGMGYSIIYKGTPQRYGGAIKTNGTLWMWGAGSDGQLGSNVPGGIASSAIQVGSDTNWSSLTLSMTPVNPGGGTWWGSTMALKTDGTLWGFGSAYFGELGNNRSGTSFFSPIQIGAAIWSKVSNGWGSTMAITTNGTLWAWGLNTAGNLGNGTTANRSTPVQIGTLSIWDDITLGYGFSIAKQSYVV
jgi:alpha-tubulin suppressor-like RCC1 family protein